jgi:hypothetical protein
MHMLLSINDLSCRTYMEGPLLYMDRHPLTYLGSPSPGVISKKIDPRSSFASLRLFVPFESAWNS